MAAHAGAQAVPGALLNSGAQQQQPGGTQGSASSAELRVELDASELRLDRAQRRKYDCSNRPRKKPRATFKDPVPTDAVEELEPCCTWECTQQFSAQALLELRQQARTKATSRDGFKHEMKQYVNPAAQTKVACKVLGKRVCRQFMKLVFGAGKTLIDNLREVKSARASAKIG